MNYAFDPTGLIAEWPLPGLSPANRQRIAALLLRAHAAVVRTMWNDPYRFIKPMEQGFSEIAALLFEAGLLTTDVLDSILRLLLFEAAVTGDWLGQYAFQATTEARREIFPGYLGHGSVWEGLRFRFPMLFAAETMEWKGRLLEAQAGHTASARCAALEHADDYSWVKCVLSVKLRDSA